MKADHSFADYYAEFFPYEDLARFFTTGDSGEGGLMRRRVALFGDDGRVVERNASYADAQEWRRLIAEHPQTRRVEMGAEFLAPHGRDERAMLAFDLDVEDYADVLFAHELPTKERGLDEGSWQHLVLSARLLDLLVGELNTRSHRSLAVFSGRRGLHLWVPTLFRDWQTRSWYENLFSSFSNFRTVAGATHAVAYLRVHASEWLNDAVAFVRHQVATVGPQALLTRLVDRDLKSMARIALGNADDDDSVSCLAVALLAPRPDREVTRSHVHLLKCPFSVHPSTGLVSLPFELHARRAPALAELRVTYERPEMERFERAMSVLDRANRVTHLQNLNFQIL